MQESKVWKYLVPQVNLFSRVGTVLLHRTVQAVTAGSWRFVGLLEVLQGPEGLESRVELCSSYKDTTQ